jgi:hypothetical protein
LPQLPEWKGKIACNNISKIITYLVFKKIHGGHAAYDRKKLEGF